MTFDFLGGLFFILVAILFVVFFIVVVVVNLLYPSVCGYYRLIRRTRGRKLSKLDTLKIVLLQFDFLEGVYSVDMQDNVFLVTIGFIEDDYTLLKPYNTALIKIMKILVELKSGNVEDFITDEVHIRYEYIKKDKYGVKKPERTKLFKISKEELLKVQWDTICGDELNEFLIGTEIEKI